MLFPAVVLGPVLLPLCLPSVAGTACQVSLKLGYWDLNVSERSPLLGLVFLGAIFPWQRPQPSRESVRKAWLFWMRCCPEGRSAWWEGTFSRRGRAQCVPSVYPFRAEVWKQRFIRFQFGEGDSCKTANQVSGKLSPLKW